MRNGSIRVLGIAVALLAAACGGRSAPTGPAGDHTTTAALPFVEDDAPKALADARTRGVPVFVEAWAPW